MKKRGGGEGEEEEKKILSKGNREPGRVFMVDIIIFISCTMGCERMGVGGLIKGGERLGGGGEGGAMGEKMCCGGGGGWWCGGSGGWWGRGWRREGGSGKRCPVLWGRWVIGETMSGAVG